MQNFKTLFENIIPPLTQEEYLLLEDSILSEGVREPIIVWGDIVIDGHNRLSIIKKHNLDCKFIQKEFDNDTDAKIWIIRNQFGRRNLSTYQRAELALNLKSIFQQKAKENQGMRTDILTTLSKSYDPINTRREIASISGLAEGTISKVEKIKQLATPQILEKVENGGISINKAFSDVKRIEKRENIDKSFILNKIPEGEYDVIYCDPPWLYEHCESPTREIENQYKTMDLQSIQEIKIPASKNSVIFMWATAPKLEEALSVLISWGFNYRTCAIWDKQIIGMGYWFRGQHELLLIGVKGKVTPPMEDVRVSSVYSEKRTQHSRKPDFYYNLIEKYFPNGKYLELFSRKKYNDKWTTWGSES